MSPPLVPHSTENMQMSPIRVWSRILCTPELAKHAPGQAKLLTKFFIDWPVGFAHMSVWRQVYCDNIGCM